MCAVIFAASEMTQELQLGIHIRHQWSKGMTVSEAAMALANNILEAQLATFVVQLSPH